MTYAILGSGAIGQAIATQFARKGLAVMLANSRGAASLVEQARALGPEVEPVSAAQALQADTLILALPFVAIPSAVRDAGPWDGRIVVDASNAIDFPAFTPTDLGGRPSSEVISDLLPGARLVKAFNTLAAAQLAADPAQQAGRRVLFLSGDHAAANADVARLMEQLGYAAVDLGKLGEGGLLQQFGGPLTVHSFLLQS